MRISTLLFGLKLLALGVLHAHEGRAQAINISTQRATVQDVFKQIEKQAGISFYYTESAIADVGLLTLDIKNKSLDDALAILGKQANLGFKRANNVVAVTKAPRIPREGNPVRIIEDNAGGATQHTITGRVLSEDGEPLVGATVTAKEINRAEITNTDGHFTFYDTPTGTVTVLTISFIGYETKEVRVRENLNAIVLTPSTSSLSEILVNKGYYTEKRALSTGSVGRVTAEEIETQPVSNPLAAMMGRVAGLDIVQQNGVPGGSFTVRVRGQNSIGNGNDPLYIIDGVPFTSTPLSSELTSGEILPQDGTGSLGGVSPLNYLNPADIASIEVLKDASATAIYGSRGSNGVVLITTKRGHVGQTKLSFNLYSGASRVANFADLLNTEQYLMMRHEGKRNDNAAILTSDYDLNGAWDTTRYTDWQKELLGGTANATNAQLTFSGGNTLTQFNLGGGYHRETTVFPGNNADQRFSGHFSLTNKSSDDKLSTTASINYSAGKSNFITKDLTGAAFDLVPVAPPLYTEDGKLNWQNNTWENPLRYLIAQYGANTTNLIGNVVVSYQILDGLQIKANIGVTNTKMDAIRTQPKDFVNPAMAPTIDHRTYFASTDFKNWIVEPQLTYSRIVGRGQLELLVGASLFEQFRSGSTMTGIGFSSEALMKNLGAANVIQGSNTYSQYRYGSVLGRVNYVYDNRYVIDVTGRRDGSSRFGPGKQFANFAALGGAWIFSNEAFIENLATFLSHGKLRVSYGTTGNDQLGDYEYMDSYTSVVAAGYMGNTGLAPVRLSNPTFAWEINRKFETGMELGFWNDRLFAEVSYYRNRSSNQLIGYSLPPTTGFFDVRANLPATVQNSGVEIQLSSIITERAHFSWKTALNLSLPRNKLVAFPNLEGSTIYANRLVVGEPMDILKLYHYTGVSPENGLYQFEDTNEDGVLNQTDRYVIRFVGRDYFGGMQNNIQFKRFDLSLFLQFVKQQGTNFRGSATIGGMTQQHGSVLRRWRQPGDETDVQRSGSSPQAGTAHSNFFMSDGIIADKSFIRLKNLSLSYALGNRINEGLRFQHAKLFIQGQNLLTFTNFIGMDPEAANGSLPPLRTITAGVSITL